MTTFIKKQQPNLPSLTGLRFWDVMFILLNHLLLGYVPRDNVLFQNLLPRAGEIGMDIFFILSGFIIHYNYSASITSFSKSSLYSFIVARIARLYPLYIFLFAVELILVGSNYSKHDILHSLIFFFTMSQSWFYDLNSAGQTVFYMYPQTSISWSVSTEMLMYFSYPLILKLVLKDKFGCSFRALIVIVITILCSLLLSWLNNHLNIVDQYGIRLFGEQASLARSPSYSSAVWFVFISPFVRVFEFIIGVLVCHLFLSLKNVPVSTKESHIMSVLGLLSAGFILATFLPNEYSIGWINQSLKVIGYYPFIAFIMFVCTRYQKSLLDQFFSWKFFVQQGEYSYSIYLFHIFIYAYAVHVLESVLPSPIRIGLLWTTVFVCAFILYRFIEMPGRKWLKNKLMSYYESFANKKT